MREEVRETVEGQVAWLREIDDKAMRTLRFNAVLLGLIVPVFSFAVKFGLVNGTEAFYNGHTAVGIFALVTSTMLAGLTYTSSRLEGGVSSDDVREAKRRGLTDEEVHDTFISSYAKWIRANRRIIYWNTFLVTFTILLTVSAFVFLSLGVASAILGGIPDGIEYIAYLGLLVGAVASQFF